jgi:hypothetical protein
MNNPLMENLLIAADEEFAKKFLTPCPFPLGDRSFYNFSIGLSPLMPQFLTGQYINHIRLYSETDDNIASITLKTEFIYA